MQQVGIVEKDLKAKYKVLKNERLQCIQSKLKEKLGVELDIEEFNQPDAEDGEEQEGWMTSIDATIFVLDDSADVEKMEEMPEPKENENPTSLEAIVAEQEQQQEEEKSEQESEQKPSEEEGDKPAEEEGEKPAEGEGEKQAEEENAEKPAEETAATEENQAPEDDKPKAPPIKTIPLEELAPLPSQDELLGKVEKLLETVENAEESLEKNKLRQEQALQDQLKRRRSRRKRIRDQAQAQPEPKPELEEPKPELEEPKPCLLYTSPSPRDS